ncbi:MAG: hypothetical protein IPJ77_17425 [Planctomycetes bacterium]|nr:hypothetical protein [Planctomycetota bacterium]
MHSDSDVRSFFTGASLALLLAAGSQAQTIWYVNSAAPSGGDGTSWATAFDSLEPAISAAVPADRIWVAAGTYHPTNLADPLDPRSARFRIASHLKLFGGFNGTETALSQRNPDLFDDTILSGDLGLLGDPSDNAYRVIEMPTFPASGIARIDGFRITGGNATEHGGGMVVGMTGMGFNPRVTLVSCTIDGNQAVRGGAIAVENFGVVRLVRCTVIENSATEHGGAIYSYSGGVQAVNSRFSYNTAGGDGGALWADSSGIDWIEYANCLFVSNEADRGGAAFLKGGNSTSGVGSWFNCTLVLNQALTSGGALYAITTTPAAANAHVYNSVLWNNTAPSDPTIFGAGLDVRFSDVQGGYTGLGNLNVDPQFTGSVRPATGSPVNDAGSNSLIPNDFLDLDGDGNTTEPLPRDMLEAARRANDPMAPNTGEGSSPIVDMGAYERSISGTTPP